MQQPDTANNARESAGLKVHGPTPTIGRTVHYRGPGTANGQFQPKTYPAVITTVHSDTCVNLFVMTDVGHMNLTSITQGDGPEDPSRWSWPPRT